MSVFTKIVFPQCMYDSVRHKAFKHIFTWIQIGICEPVYMLLTYIVHAGDCV